MVGQDVLPCRGKYYSCTNVIQIHVRTKLEERQATLKVGMGAMQNYVMHCDVRSWRASGVMFDKTHCDRRSNNGWEDSLLVLVDEYLVDFLLKDKGVVEHHLRSCPRQVQEVELETFPSRSWSKGEWTDERDTCVCSGRVLFSAGSKRPLSQDCGQKLRPGDLAASHHSTAIQAIQVEEAQHPSRFPLDPS